MFQSLKLLIFSIFFFFTFLLILFIHLSFNLVLTDQTGFAFVPNFEKYVDQESNNLTYNQVLKLDEAFNNPHSLPTMIGVIGINTNGTLISG